MPKMKGETDQQWMERIKRFRDREKLFEQVRAAKCYIASRGGDEALELAAFMHIFHPRPEGYTRNDIKRMFDK